MIGRIHVLLFAAVGLAVSACASFGPLTPSAAPCEREYIWPEGKMPDAQPRPLGGLAKHTTAWQDLQRAVRVVRGQAAAKGLDPNRIGIMGSSAGGHLTLMGATSARHRSYWPIDAIDKQPCNVQWAASPGTGSYT